MPFYFPSDDTMEEIAVSAPIFEGQLYIRNEKKNWVSRLFRFDGSQLTCLSTRKMKFPPNTTADDAHYNTPPDGISLTSPLLATPKDKIRRLTDEPSELQYYQLPEWIIDVAQMTSISLFRKAKKLQNHTNCFSIRTTDGKYYLFKAPKHKDLERWLFVITKMWHFTQAVRAQSSYYPPSPPPQQYNIPNDDNAPLVNSVLYDSKYRSPILSEKKTQVIDEWRKSLAELMAHDSNIQPYTPPPIVPIPDDDVLSIYTDMTSISHRNKPPLVRKKSSSLKKPIKPRMQPLGDSSQSVRKKRSDDVGHWMNNKNTSNLSSSPNNQVPTYRLSLYADPLINDSSISSKSRKNQNQNQNQNINFFQDAVTIHEEEESVHQHYPTTYHTESIRGKRPLVTSTDQPITMEPTRSVSPTIPLTMDMKSPLQYLVMDTSKKGNNKKQEEEEMSLADLQKSFRRISLYKQPLQQSFSDSTNYFNTNTNNNIYNNNIHEYPSPFVAPIIPPIPMHSVMYGYNAYPEVPIDMNSNAL
ncbi:hypothetical protein BDB01DRAFT_432939 [Pilobolus umbonatus]|nr:hypothetical protein BDB01DRAFT_432939 [Pilobolus umbonatus]